MRHRKHHHARHHHHHSSDDSEEDERQHHSRKHSGSRHSPSPGHGDSSDEVDERTEEEKQRDMVSRVLKSLILFF